MANDKDKGAQAPTAKATAPKLIWVRSLLPIEADGGSRVALFEQNDAHPDGEAFVAGETPVQVAQTGAVLKALANGQIEETDAPAKKE
jgi:hypothetical protein